VPSPHGCLYSENVRIDFDENPDNPKHHEIGSSKENGTLFVSISTTLRTSADCQVMFNDDGYWENLYTDMPMERYREIYKISVRGSTSGTLEVWAEGQKKR
jgi:hypothetical protein